MANLSGCTGCDNCQHYPYFHHVPNASGDDIEFIKFSEEYSTVTNHTAKEKYEYKGGAWGIVSNVDNPKEN